METPSEIEIKKGCKALDEFLGMTLQERIVRSVNRGNYHTDYNLIHKVWAKLRELTSPKNLKSYTPVDKNIIEALKADFLLKLNHSSPLLAFIALVSAVEFFNKVEQTTHE